jgi:excinuclease ABC subunit A
MWPTAHGSEPTAPVDPVLDLRVPFGAMAQEFLVVRGAREHNLKNISVAIPRNRLTVITGLSGSGKSSLAFDTIYAEGQRRYVESLSAYARQFLGLMEKPDVDAIEGLSPAISIEQKTTGQNPRSTVGTVTEVYDYLRLLWARAGVPHCPNDGTPVTRQSAAQITDTVLGWPEESRIEVLAPLVRGRKGEFRDMLEDAASCAYGWTERRTTWARSPLSTGGRITISRSWSIAWSCGRAIARD